MISRNWEISKYANPKNFPKSAPDERINRLIKKELAKIENQLGFVFSSLLFEITFTIVIPVEIYLHLVYINEDNKTFYLTIYYACFRSPQLLTKVFVVLSAIFHMFYFDASFRCWNSHFCFINLKITSNIFNLLWASCLGSCYVTNFFIVFTKVALKGFYKEDY